MNDYCTYKFVFTPSRLLSLFTRGENSQFGIDNMDEIIISLPQIDIRQFFNQLPHVRQSKCKSSCRICNGNVMYTTCYFIDKSITSSINIAPIRIIILYKSQELG